MSTSLKSMASHRGPINTLAVPRKTLHGINRGMIRLASSTTFDFALFLLQSNLSKLPPILTCKFSYDINNVNSLSTL